jgi:hypothetical protein
VHTHLNTNGHEDVDLALDRLVRLGSGVDERDKFVVDGLMLVDALGSLQLTF